MSKLYLMSGPSGSGKTTYAKYFAKEHDLLYLCPDDFYGLIHGDDRIHTDEFDVWMTMWRAIHLAEQNGRDCIVDTNSPTHVDRDQFLNWFDRFDEHHLVFVTASPELCIKNNASRRRVIPEDEMRRILAKVEFPTVDEDLRWDSITICVNDDNHGFGMRVIRGVTDGPL